MNCPVCAEPAIAGAAFCEACGAELAPTPGCESCGAAAAQIDEHGYCGVCGHKQPDPRDHLEIDLGPVAVVTDRGQRHHRNEDHGGIAIVDGVAVIVVCDGVSTTDNPEQASLAAVDAAIAVLSGAVTDGSPLEQAMVDAAAAAQQVVLTVPLGATGVAPSCTFVAGVVPLEGPGVAADGTRDLVVGWLGDSRAYVLDADGAEQVGTDHSWASELIASGMPAAEAHAHPRAHTITRWLGADAPDVVPVVLRRQVAASARVLLCSDGLWNYAEAAADLAARPELDLPTPLAQAAALTAFANAAGGQDNITVAIARLAEVATDAPTDRSGDSVTAPTESADTRGGDPAAPTP